MCDSALFTKAGDHKKEVQEEEKDERRHWGVGTGSGWKVYGELTLCLGFLLSVE